MKENIKYEIPIKISRALSITTWDATKDKFGEYVQPKNALEFKTYSTQMI